MSNLLERYKSLHIIDTDSHVSEPFVLWTKRAPKQYAERVCFWFDETATHFLIDRLGTDNVTWETDFPHPTCLFPNPVARVAETEAHLSDEAARKVMQDNAAKLYKIELPPLA